MTLSEKIRTYRKQCGYTQQQAADAIGITKSAYCGYETGKRLPDIYKLKQLSVLFGFSLDEILESDKVVEDLPSPTISGEMTLSQKIRQHRKELGLTQTELGERVGVKKNAVSKWECGRVEDIPMEKIRALATLFNVPVSYLVDSERTEASSCSTIEMYGAGSKETENNISVRIRDLRVKHNLTLEQVAQQVGVGRSTVRKWETGIISNMRRDKIAKLASALYTTPAYLMGWEDSDFSMDSSEEKQNSFRASAIIKERTSAICNRIPGFDKLPQDDAMELYALVRSALMLTQEKQRSE